MKKVIVRLGNGIGNQLFTYAAAYVYAKKKEAKLYVDDESGFYKLCKYELNDFNISPEIVEKKYKFIGPIARMKRKILKNTKILNKNIKFLEEKKNRDKTTYYDPNNLNVEFRNLIYFEGYFQSEIYFKSEEKSILKEFSFKNNVINQSNKFIEQIKKSDSISIHIRQNKFLPMEGHKNLESLNENNLKQNIKISKKGIEYFDKNIENPKYFVWSDNFSGLREHFPSDKFTFVDVNINHKTSYDLYLMSLCKNFILSPSTMHYWGAYLSNYNNKICLAPENIKNKSGYYGFSNNKDIRPDWWI